MNAAFWRGRRVLVTGHTGFKGGWLSLWLGDLGADVYGLALAPDTEPALFDLAGLAGRMDSRFGDIRDAAVVRDRVHEVRPEIVLHLAAQPLVRASYQDPLGTLATNVLGTAHVLDAVRGCDSVRVVLVVTTDKVYENRGDARAFREDDRLGGADPYSASKACAELVTAAWRASFFRGAARPAIATARAGNVIGGGDWSADRLLPDLVRGAIAGAPVPIRNPLATRPWQHVLEPLAGYMALCERLWKGAPSDEPVAWNFGPPATDERTVEWLANAFQRAWGGGAHWQHDAREHPHEARLLALDSTRATTELDWRPRLDADEALEWSVEWYRQHQAGSASPLDMTLAQIRRYGQL
ncbi:MAG TPA: CDP-glucose 4,6-dehydratase [Longimicrobiales bacterium]|nr:CDP-glucose 4,6-dehydratase [Longimicrobiales bacterium]